MKTWNPSVINRESRVQPRWVAEVRRGVSLSEVLISLLVLSIGVVSVATLFPLSVLRTVQATQLTNGTQLRYNFEGLAGAKPELMGARPWEPRRQFVAGEYVFPSVPGSYVFECTNTGMSGPIEPAWVYAAGQATQDADTGQQWVARNARVYVVDPLGWEERNAELGNPAVPFAEAAASANVRNTFGRLNLDTPAAVPPFASPQRILRLPGGVPGSMAGAAVLPDSWTLQLESTDLSGLTANSVQLTNSSSQLVPTFAPGGTEVDFQGTHAAIFARITFFDVTGRASIVRPLSRIETASAGVETFEWTSPLIAPPGVTWVRARVETFDPRYSWMLAVRRSPSGAAYPTLVVFFRRSYAPEDELIHNTHFLALPPGGSYPGNGTDRVVDLRVNAFGGISPVLATTGAPGKPIVVVEYNPALGVGTPFLKRGSFICDAQNNRWYRVVSYDEVSNARAAAIALDQNLAASYEDSPPRPGAIVRLESPILESSGAYNNGVGGAILMRSIVDVFPMPAQFSWE